MNHCAKQVLRVTLVLAFGHSAFGQVESPCPACYWKCPVSERPDAKRAPGFVARIEGRYSRTQSGPGKPTWLVRDDNGPGDGYNTRRLRLNYTHHFNGEWAGFAHIRRDWGMDEFCLQDAYVTYGGWPAANLTVGQMIVPFGREYPTADMKIPLAERSRAGVVLVPQRDVGLLFHNDKATDRVGWYAGLYTGNGIDDVGSDGTFLAAVRAEWLATDCLNIGANWMRNDGPPASPYQKLLKKNGQAYDLQPLYDTEALDEEGWGIDALYRRVGANVWAGYTRKRVSGPGTDIQADGWYIYGGKMLHIGEGSDRLELVLGHEQLDPNTAVTDQLDARWSWVGLNYHLDACRQWRLQYVIRDEARDEVRNDTLILQYEHVFRDI